MDIDKEFWTTLVITIVNILVLYFILKKLLFKPVTNFMNGRTNKIEEALKTAEEAKLKVEEMEKEHQEKLKEMKEKGQALMKSYEQKAKKSYDTIIAQAKKDSNLLIEKTKSDLEIEKEQLITSLKEEIADLVIKTSEKVIAKNLDNKENRKLIEEFIKEEK